MPFLCTTNIDTRVPSFEVYQVCSASMSRVSIGSSTSDHSSVVEHQHDVLYYPIRATVTMDLKVMTPDQFRCSNSTVAEIAIAAYEYTRAQRDLAAIVSTADLSPLWRLVAPI
jgi:hypothetical protein